MSIFGCSIGLIGPGFALASSALQCDATAGVTGVLNPSSVIDSTGRVCSRLNFCGARVKRTRLLSQSILAGRKGHLAKSDLFCSHMGKCKRTFSGIVVASAMGGGVLANSCYCCGRLAGCTFTAGGTITISCSRNSDLFVRTSALRVCACCLGASSVFQRAQTCRGMHVCHASIRKMYSSLIFSSGSDYLAVCCSPVL